MRKLDHELMWGALMLVAWFFVMGNIETIGDNVPETGYDYIDECVKLSLSLIHI